MGLAASVLRLLVRLHGEQPWGGPVVTLGVQDVHATHDDLTRIFREERVRSEAVPPAERLPSTSRYFRQSGREGTGYVHARVFFRMLGLAGYDDLDFADFEKPTLTHDLNRPVPEAWRRRYGLVVDGGTLEHIFDVRAALANITALLRVGGDVCHICPLSGWVNHGFYQISPCLLYDLYGANGFDAAGAFVVQLPRDPARHAEVVRPLAYTESALDLDDAAYRSLLLFRARKRAEQPLRVPTQGVYRQLGAGNGRAAA
jgi:hypothetical protein